MKKNVICIFISYFLFFFCMDGCSSGYPFILLPSPEMTYLSLSVFTRYSGIKLTLWDHKNMLTFSNGRF